MRLPRHGIRRYSVTKKRQLESEVPTVRRVHIACEIPPFCAELRMRTVISRKRKCARGNGLREPGVVSGTEKA
jgi:hypothetical protein